VLLDLVGGEPYDLVFLIAGLAALGAAVIPKLLSDRAVSFPLLYLLMGVAVFALPLGIDAPDPREHVELFERLAELAVIVALMGVGLKLDRRIGWRRWMTTWRLLGITMPLTIAAIFALGWGLGGLVPATALLVAASLAPTDPVLAADVEVPGPYAMHEDEMRFGLTSEAGLNDGLAFPFVNAALLMATAGASPEGWIARWLAVDVAYKLVVGVAVGALVGKLLGDVLFRMADSDRLADVSGFAALAATLVTYGLTEIAGGYGFLAVFAAAVVLRHHQGSPAYHEHLATFTEEAERLLLAGLLILFGGAVDAGILDALTWPLAAVGVLVVLVVRPVAGWAGMLGSDVDRRHRVGLAFFGIRGMGSIYYLAHGLAAATFVGSEAAWALVALVIVLSVTLHGLTSTPFMRRLEAPDGGGEADEALPEPDDAG
jgi:sodium/hydrogen antiporter